MSKLKKNAALLDKAVKSLLACDGGPRAQNNRRKAVLELLLRVRSALDEEHPNQRTRKTRPRKRRAGWQIEAEMRNEGWTEVPHYRVLALENLGVRVVRRHKSNVHKPTYWVRKWEKRIAEKLGAQALAKAQKSPTERKALEVEILLSGSVGI